MSHDLKTPLTSMKTTQYLMRRELNGEAAARLDMLDYQTERLNEILENMLTLLRLDDDNRADLHQFDVNQLLLPVVQRYTNRVQKGGALLEFVPGTDLPPILADNEELDIALSNLLDNALQYTPDGGSIIVRSLRENGQVKISVRDSGAGIAEEHLAHIFDRFYRADTARGTEKGGSGLGLTIAKRIVERHGGEIRVSSQLGEGSEFQLLLPVQASSGGSN
jgi:signal transduction histidine kinase